MENKFEILNSEFVGKGSSGEVYRITARNSSIYIIKIINITTYTEIQIIDLMQEIDIMKNLSHPFIIKLKDYILCPE